MSLKNFVNNLDPVIETDTGRADLRYFQMDTRRIDVQNQTGRTTRQYQIPSTVLDRRKTATGRSPNYVHFREADLLRRLGLRFDLDIITVHDAFYPSLTDAG